MLEKEYEIIKVTESEGSQYKDCYIEVILKVIQGKDERELAIRYPVQNKRHLILLMSDVNNSREIDYIERKKIAEKIREVVNVRY